MAFTKCVQYDPSLNGRNLILFAEHLEVNKLFDAPRLFLAWFLHMNPFFAKLNRSKYEGIHLLYELCDTFALFRMVG